MPTLVGASALFARPAQGVDADLRRHDGGGDNVIGQFQRPLV
nr:hypothetical protein [uncultured Rhodopila sp.]